MLKTYLQALINAIVKYNVEANLADIEIGNFRVECGSVVLNEQTEITVYFRKPFAFDPIIAVTAIDNPLQEQSFLIENKHNDRFSIRQVDHYPIRFDYIAIGRKSY